MMSTHGPDAAPEGNDARESRRAEPGAGPRPGRMQRLGVIAGLMAGLVAFAIGEVTHDLIPAGRVQQNLMGSRVMVPDRDASAVADARNAALTFGVLGLCLGAGLGVAGGLARRSTPGAVAGGLVGSSLGAALGGGVSLAVLTRFIAAKYSYFEYDLPISMAMHGLIWGLLGAAAGLAYAIGLGERRRCAPALFAGLIGAVLGSVAYDIIGAVFFQAANTDEPISEAWPTRLLACLLVTVGAAVALAVSLPESIPAQRAEGLPSPPGRA
jgi:hypothetical protein